MSNDNAQQAITGSSQKSALEGESDTPAGEIKKKSFVVMFDDDEIAPDAATDGNNEKTLASTATTGNESSDRAPGSFVVLLDDDNPEDEIARIASINAEGNCTVKLPEDIGIRHIMKIKNALSLALEASSVTFDASNVDIVDTSSIQLLHAHQICLRENNIPIQWSRRSERFSSVEKRLGFDLSQ